MRVRTASIMITKAFGLEPAFEHALNRHVAWVVGDGHVYADLERVAKRNGYRVFVPEKDEPDYWFAVRSDLIKDESWEPAKTQVRFEPTRESLGTVLLNTDPDFNFGDRVSSDQLTEPVEHDGYTYGERLLSVKAS